MKYLIYGYTGWIGNKLSTLIQESDNIVIGSVSRMENRRDLLNEISMKKPDRVIVASGKTGTPNVDWCEDNKEETLVTNVIGILDIVDVCKKFGIHCTVFATGCIFEYDEKHKVGGIGFKEDDSPNFKDSYYSYTKGVVEELIRNSGYLDNTLILRIRMPISDKLEPKNFITKIVGYEKVINIPNSMSVLTDLLPISIKMSEVKETGIYNFTNPGVISHNDCLEYYKMFVDSEFEYTNFTVEEQDTILKSKRSNNFLSTTKLQTFCSKHNLELPGIHTSVRKILKNIKK